MGFESPDAMPAPQSTKIETMPRQGLAPVGKKPKPKSPSATFLSSAVEPGPASGNMGGKTLIGM